MYVIARPVSIVRVVLSGMILCIILCGLGSPEYRCYDNTGELAITSCYTESKIMSVIIDLHYLITRNLKLLSAVEELRLVLLTISILYIFWLL